MDNKGFAKILEERTIQLGVDIIMLSVKIPNTEEGKIIRNQITKSGTSIGANYFEANRAKSKADFSNKIKICEGEANETVFWLTILDRLNWIDKVFHKPVYDEVIQLLAIFTSINSKIRNDKTKL